MRRTVERIETLYGTLSSVQRAQLGEALARSPFNADGWLAERREQQQEALSMLRRFGATAGAAHAAATQAALRSYISHIERSPRDAYRRYAERLREFNCGVAAEFHNATTTAQRQAAARKLAGWEADARALAAAAPAGAGAPMPGAEAGGR